MKFARWAFSIAAVYGLIILLPLYSLEQRIGRDTPPPITHPEYFYGFVGAAVVMQLLYVLIATDPSRYRPAMPIAALAKLSFGIPMAVLYLQGRVPAVPTLLSGVDAILAILFIAAYRATGSGAAA